MVLPDLMSFLERARGDVWRVPINSAFSGGAQWPMPGVRLPASRPVTPRPHFVPGESFEQTFGKARSFFETEAARLSAENQLLRTRAAGYEDRVVALRMDAETLRARLADATAARDQDERDAAVLDEAVAGLQAMLDEETSQKALLTDAGRAHAEEAARLEALLRQEVEQQAAADARAAEDAARRAAAEVVARQAREARDAATAALAPVRDARASADARGADLLRRTTEVERKAATAPYDAKLARIKATAEAAQAAAARKAEAVQKLGEASARRTEQMVQDLLRELEATRVEELRRTTDALEKERRLDVERATRSLDEEEAQAASAIAAVVERTQGARAEEIAIADAVALDAEERAPKVRLPAAPVPAVLTEALTVTLPRAPAALDGIAPRRVPLVEEDET